MKVLVKLRLCYGTSRHRVAKNIVVEPQANSSLRTVLRSAIRKARLNENTVRTRYIRKRDDDFDEDVDIDEDDRPVHLAKYEVGLEDLRPQGRAATTMVNEARQAAPRVQPAQVAPAANAEAAAGGINSPRTDTIEIIVKTLSNRTCKFTVGPLAPSEDSVRVFYGIRLRTHFQWTEPVAPLMQQVFDLEYTSQNLPFSQFKFVFLGRAMRGEKTFTEYRLENGSKIEVTL